MAGKMVLSDELLVAYENYALEPRRYNKKYKQLMSKLILPYETNKAQLVRAKVLGLNAACYDRLLPIYAGSITKDYDLPALAATTSLKFILTSDTNVQLPYLNIKSNFTANNLTISLSPAESRADLSKYLEMVSADATKVTICDNYIAQNWSNTRALFLSILPRNNLNIEYVETSQTVNATLNSTKITAAFVKGIHADWTVSPSTLYANSHDRYLRIESPTSKIEIMLSSGFDHIWKHNPKEITCVFREIT
ncbi:hypothetical protein [Moritella sp.]|uniref:hypothetical protein n=1 Tax=Moritella sp. TaxID=78556 RepID=UPI001DAA9148|nr:hypothetical protein [Moritella sp.]MCJ8349180.1 hypothetical protein [Moritella sp.]NQZ39468.1 hypothetical protein [Moritella sp.]